MPILVDRLQQETGLCINDQAGKRPRFLDQDDQAFRRGENGLEPISIEETVEEYFKQQGITAPHTGEIPIDLFQKRSGLLVVDSKPTENTEGKKAKNKDKPIPKPGVFDPTDSAYAQTKDGLIPVPYVNALERYYLSGALSADVVGTVWPDQIPDDLTDQLAESVKGQEEMIEAVVSIFRSFHARSKRKGGLDKLVKIAILGLSGIGKTFLAKTFGRILDVPVAHVELGDYVKKEKEEFFRELEAIHGRYPEGGVLILDEITKLRTVSRYGTEIERGVMGPLHQLLDTGVITFYLEEKGENGKTQTREVTLDFRKFFVFEIGNLFEELYGHLAKNLLDLPPEDLLAQHKALGPTDVREGLSRLFADSFIARLGPIVLANPLSAKAYKEIIDSELDKVAQEAHAQKQLTLEFTPAFRKALEMEAIVPVLGARPIGPSVDCMLGTPLNLSIAQLPASARVEIDYEQAVGEGEKPNVVFRTDKKTVRQKISLLNSLPPDTASKDYRQRISVHEGGHAAAALVKKIPLRLISRRGMKAGRGGAVYFPRPMPGQKDITTLREFEDRLMVSFAGRAAEEIYYGNKWDISAGASGDLANITKQLCWAIESGLYREIRLSVASVMNNPEATAVPEELQEAVEQVMQETYDKTLKLIRENEAGFRAIVDELKQDKIGLLMPERAEEVFTKAMEADQKEST